MAWVLTWTTDNELCIAKRGLSVALITMKLICDDVQDLFLEKLVGTHSIHKL